MMNATKPAPKRVVKKADATTTPVVAATVTASVATPVVAAVVPAVAAAPTEKKTVAKRAPKAEAASAAVPVVAATPVVASTTATPAVEAAAEDSWQTDLRAVQTQLLTVRETCSTALTALKALERRVTREVREAKKSRRKARKELAEGETAAPSEFQKLKPISDELSAFLGLGKSAQMSRAEVTRSISGYIKANGLNDGQKVRHNAALRTLLGISETDELTIFNMQKYLNRHYIKPAVAVAVAPKA
jgi:chromatin remodeling complex protein RSC6